MTQDRTRAIVSAAEKLAKAMGLQLDGSWSPVGWHAERSELLADLARALALPEPLQTVIIDEAPGLTSERLRHLVSVIAAPAPKWTREPPSVPGFYWCRDSAKLPLFVCVTREEQPGEYLEGGTPASRLATMFPHFEWWPVKIEPPKETP